MGGAGGASRGRLHVTLRGLRRGEAADGGVIDERHGATGVGAGAALYVARLGRRREGSPVGERSRPRLGCASTCTQHDDQVRTRGPCVRRRCRDFAPVCAGPPCCTSGAALPASHSLRTARLHPRLLLSRALLAGPILPILLPLHDLYTRKPPRDPTALRLALHVYSQSVGSQSVQRARVSQRKSRTTTTAAFPALCRVSQQT